jgi:hypothetical protein
MTYEKYKIPQQLIEEVSNMREFKLGGTQASVVLKDGSVYHKVLLSNCMYIMAIRGYDRMPFNPEDIVDIYQSGDDSYPKQCGNWAVFD